MRELQRLSADHAAAVLDFEVTNRAYFAATISDRGDAYFAHFAQRHDALLADQRAGGGAYHVLLADDGTVVGRANLIFVGDAAAELGYRVAERASGHGVATAMVRELCGLAVTRYGLRRIRAASSDRNRASQRVLARTGFVRAGPADPADLGGKRGAWYERVLGDGREPDPHQPRGA